MTLRDDGDQRASGPPNPAPGDSTDSRRDPSRSPDRLVFLDALRGIAALMVVLPHSRGLFGFEGASSAAVFLRETLATWAQGGVQIFFVISGFVIARTLQRVSVTTSYAANFVLRRAVRLDPPYWVAIALALAVELLRTTVRGEQFVAPTLYDYLLHVTYLQTILGAQTINVVFWTLCIEFQFYLAFAVVLAIAGALERKLGNRRLAPGICALLFLAWLPEPLGPSHEAWGAFVLPWSYMFLAGALTSWTLEGRFPLRAWAVGFALVCACFAWNPSYGVFFTILTAALIMLVGLKGKLATTALHPFLQLCGRVSYSLYLVHVPVAVLTMAIRTRIAPDSNVVAFLMLLVTMAAAVGAATALHRWIEAPFTNLARRLKPRGT